MTQLMLLDKISLNEIEGLAFKCLGILKTLTGRNFSFTNDQAIIRLMEDYERVSNPFDTFISECCEITDIKRHVRENKKVHFCHETGLNLSLRIIDI
jgi:hypothetical protein